jgi:hypothetical protein
VQDEDLAAHAADHEAQPIADRLQYDLLNAALDADPDDGDPDACPTCESTNTWHGNGDEYLCCDECLTVTPLQPRDVPDDGPALTFSGDAIDWLSRSLIVGLCLTVHHRDGRVFDVEVQNDLLVDHEGEWAMVVRDWPDGNAEPEGPVYALPVFDVRRFHVS